MKSDHQFCHLCGHRFLDSVGVRNGALDMAGKGAPRIVSGTLAPKHAPNKRRGGTLEHTHLLYILLTVMAMVPLTPWVGAHDMTMGITAMDLGSSYGRYIALLAIAGMFVVFSERTLTDLRMKKAVLFLIGAGTVLLTLKDLNDVMAMQRLYGVHITNIEPGAGMYLAIACGVLLALVSILPSGPAAKAVPARVHYKIKPGSPGSGP